MLKPQIIIEGNIGKIDELRTFGENNAVINFSVAHTPRVKNKDTGEWGNGTTLWKNCTLWGEEAKNFAASAPAPGTPVVVIGTEQAEEYVARDTNEKRVSVKLNVDSVSIPFTRFSYPTNVRLNEGAPAPQASASAPATQAAPKATAAAKPATSVEADMDSIFGDTAGEEADFESIFD